MGKSNNIENKKRSKGKDKKKNTFKKYGKNTARGVRIKEAELERNAANKNAKGDNYLVKSHMEFSKTKGKWSAGQAKTMCKITCRNKKHGNK